MTEKNTHTIKSFKTLCDLVNDDNVITLSVDLANWLISYYTFIKKFRETFPEESKGKSNTEIAKGWFDWIDDGKNDIKGIKFNKKP